MPFDHFSQRTGLLHPGWPAIRQRTHLYPYAKGQVSRVVVIIISKKRNLFSVTPHAERYLL